MPRGIHTDAQHLHDILEKGVMLNKDRVEGSVDLNDDSPVYVGIMADVNGYGPHVGALYVEQNRFHGHVDTALQGADEILEQWTLDNTSQEDISELEDEYGDEWMSVLTETFDGWGFKISAREFVEAIRGTDAENLIDIEEEEDEDEGVLEEDDEDEEEDDEPEEDDDDFDLETELEDGAVVSDARGGGYSVSFGGKHLGDFDDFDEALLEAYRQAEKSNYFPNFFYVNDRGNTDLLSVEPDVVRSKIVGVTNKIIKSWV